jgi:CHAT domain-containing protein
VMFVCSAGRHDEHPRARATVGLTRLLLERGVRAVVASPWPLDTRVPPRWLPTFLKWLDHGEPISDAVFAANLDVSSHFGPNPPHALAMHLYGDPTYRCPHLPTKARARRGPPP